MKEKLIMNNKMSKIIELFTKCLSRSTYRLICHNFYQIRDGKYIDGKGLDFDTLTDVRELYVYGHDVDEKRCWRMTFPLYPEIEEVYKGEIGVR